MGSPYKLAPCGTIYAYRRHLRHMEQPCRSCKDAVAAHVRARRARARGPELVCAGCGVPLRVGLVPLCPGCRGEADVG